MKRILLLTTLLFTGCFAETVSTNKTENPKVDVGLLFSHDGCKIYAFTDGGERHYFVKCGQEQKTIGKDKCTTHYNAATKTSQVICVPGEDIQTVNNW